ncbi:nucleotidyltransferase family protein [Arenibacter sp. BSSL-BM3]|uniref:Nucleotidyltransferase family protein n=1 Tax=Arenibacter arenosicollis TaxID=2762274 RepID=A0ABR7QM45_9FLAO|nr:nucleotidyltransferase family protein [Arenibacter arenosicollis]MBC8768234.1 nucleotidyltransferase family protein [Arenibacter arenosicollis]
MTPKEHNIAILIMAAGTSSRMKAIKQLLPWGNTTLIGNALKNAQDSNAATILTVLGAYKEEIIKETQFGDTETVYTPDWKMGLGNSIACGTKHLLKKEEDYDGVLIMLTDQPYIDGQYLNTMMDNFTNSQHSIIATKYTGRVGVPAIFGKAHFEALLALDSDFGARDIIKTHIKNVLTLSPKGKEVDIDTLEEYERVKKSDK